MVIQFSCDNSKNYSANLNNENSNFLLKNSCHNDKFLKYYRIHLSIHEENFYGHIQSVKLLIIENKLRYPWDIFPNPIEPIIKYNNICKALSQNFGCCYLSKSKQTNENVILKHIINSFSNHLTKSIKKETELLLILKSDHIIKLIEEIVIEKNGFHSIWYVFEYNPSVSLELINILLHRKILKSKVDDEHDFVHLLYTCNSTLDKSKENFPDFMNIVRNLFLQLLSGVSYFHEKGIIHKYLNPSNIIITTNGVLKITDLGCIKQFHLLQYCSRAFVEFGFGEDYLSLKDPLKRMKYCGNYYYIEPHIRAQNLNEKTFLKHGNNLKNLDFHVDYFSCSMIIFEMIFGFTYGDLELYRKYSFYKQFSKFELIFFFPDYYINPIKGFSNFEMAIQDFNNFRLDRLKSFLINHEYGLIDFLIEGLHADISRWTKYLKLTTSGQYIDFTILKNEIKFFEMENTKILLNNIPNELIHILKEYHNENEIMEFSQKLNEKLILTNKKVQFNLQSNKYQQHSFVKKNSFDSKSFYIPELPQHFIVNSSSEIKEHSLELFQYDSNIVNIPFINNNKSKLENKITEDISSKNEEKIENRLNEISIEESAAKKFPSVFIHNFFNNLETKRKFDVINRRLHKLTDTHVENTSNKEPVTTQSLLNNKIHEQNNQYSQIINKYKMNPNNIIDKYCSNHSKRPFSTNQNGNMEKFKLKSKQLNSYKRLKKQTDLIKFYNNTECNKELIPDFARFSPYQLNQYQMYNYFRAPKFQISKQISTQENIVHNSNIKSNISKSKPKIKFKNITTFGSTKSNSQIPLNDNNQSNTTSLLTKSVLNEIKLKELSLNHLNYLEINQNRFNDKVDLENSIKNIYFDNVNKKNHFQSKDFQFHSEIDRDKFKQKSKIKTMDKFGLLNHEKSQLRKSSIFKKQNLNQMKKNCRKTKSFTKNYNLLDSNVIKLLTEKKTYSSKKHDDKNTNAKKDEFIQTWSNDLPVIDCATLLNNSKTNISNKIVHPSASVIPLKSKECQTEIDLVNNLSNTHVHYSKDIELQFPNSTDFIDYFSREYVHLESNDQNKEVDEKENESTLNKNETIIDNHLFVRESTLEKNKIYESVDFLKDIEVENPNLICEEENLKNYSLYFQITNKEPIYCNHNRLFTRFSDDLAEEFVESTERLMELFKDVPINNQSLLIISPKCDNNALIKSVSFRSPIISDVFHFEYSDKEICNFTNISKENCRKIVNVSINSSPDINEEESYFHRPKVNCYDMEIIDDWSACEETLTRNYFTQDFDLRTIDNKGLCSVTTASVIDFGSTIDDLSNTNKSSL